MQLRPAYAVGRAFASELNRLDLFAGDVLTHLPHVAAGRDVNDLGRDFRAPSVGRDLIPLHVNSEAVRPRARRASREGEDGQPGGGDSDAENEGK